MSWRGWVSCAAVLLVVGLVGCAMDSFNARIEQAVPVGDQVMIAGSAEAVAVRASAMIQGHGMTAEIVHDGPTVRLQCDTPSGKRFNLVFEEKPMPTGVETVVKLKWENGVDEPQAVYILSGLGTLNVR